MKINTKTFVLNISLVTMLTLCVFSPIYKYQKMIIILGCFIIWFISTIRIETQWINRANLSLIYLGAMFLLYLWRGFAMENIGDSVNLIVNQLPVYIWFVILEFYLYSKTPIRATVVSFFVLFLITAYFTIIGNLENPGASRLLASTLTYATAQREQYRASFIGGYDVIYGAVFLIMPLTLLARKNKQIWFVIALLVVMVVISSYTIAIILIFFMIICGVVKTKNIWALAFTFCGVFLVVTLFEQKILEWTVELAQSIDSEIMVKRITSLLSGEYFREFGDTNNRFTIYYNAILNWLDHPILGNLLTETKEYRRAGHSTLLEYLSNFGLLSTVFFLYLNRYYNVVKQYLSTEYERLFKIYFIFFVTFGLIDRYETFLTIGVCAFFIAPILFMMADRKEHGHESALVDKQGHSERR